MLKTTIDGQVILDLAESYDVSEDGLVYTVVLKDDITFHDGKPVTTDDIDFTIKKILDPSIKSPKAPNWKGVEVTILNSQTITFTLKTPYSPFLDNLTLGILPKHIWKDIDSEGIVFSQFNIKPIGSGPYKISEIKEDASGLPEYYHFVPFKNYALGKPFINDIYMYFFSNEEKMIKAFKAGTIKQMNSISPQIAKEIINKNSSLLQTPLPRMFGVFFNQNEAPVFTHKEVRAALNKAIDRQSIINNILFGFGTPTNSPLPQFIYGTKTELRTNIESSITDAQAVLEKNGWKKNTSGVYEKKDKKGNTLLSFAISTSDTPELKATAYLLKDTWEKMGAQVEVKIFELSDLNQNIIRQRKYDALLFGQSIGRYTDIFAFWHSSERNDPGLNVSMYTNSKVDKIIDELRKTTSEEKRLELYTLFENEIDTDIPAVFIYSPDFIYITQKDVQGININGIINQSERFLDINNWYVNTQKIWKIFN
jgi:peptide/nickel transport system substrate-binding protein